MNLVNITKHLLYLTKTEFGSANSVTSADEFFAAQQLFEVLKAFKDSYFSEFHTYETLEFDDEYDEITDEEESDDESDTYDENDETDDYDKNQQIDIRSHFTLEEMKNIIEWIDQHPHYSFSGIQHAQDWVENIRPIISNYSPREILNTDHCSFQQKYVSPRTLSFTGERTTEVAVRKKHKITHSYTVQPITSADGRLLDKFLLILQEKENQFGKRVQTDLYVPSNVVVQASKSGKSSGEKHRIFLNEVLRPSVGRKFLLFLDCWKTQTDLKKFRAVFPNQNSQLLVFPEGSTGHIQPQDLSLFRSWRFFHKKIEHYTHINRTELVMKDRQYFINMHCVIHNQLSAPQFKNLINSGFVQAKIVNETISEIEKPKDICFKFYELYCSIDNCGQRTLLKCAWCNKHLCYYHLIEDIHFHL
ncbi:unnamed protein product [Rotaria sp. Silwood2]|nr:unnamed protein product [Rotaria sp. Silwood2]CAF3072271.1 unnamed protein product [Rotaria sp. Silwood2]CAF3395512.1 unnamed protein product [Rotaria sp. Silwood2]CAF4300159.1 unnamed protein product [Rotaria sp. Silwood2]CAF4319384.1 unnamed protein product [Rotaria sp. Silwood2]